MSISKKQFKTIDPDNLNSLDYYFNKRSLNLLDARNYLLLINYKTHLIDSTEACDKELNDYIVDLMYKLLVYGYKHMSNSKLIASTFSDNNHERKGTYAGTYINIYFDGKYYFYLNLDEPLHEWSLSRRDKRRNVLIHIDISDIKIKDNSEEAVFHNLVASDIGQSELMWIEDTLYQKYEMFAPILADPVRTNIIQNALKDKIRQNNELFVWLYLGAGLV